VCARALPQAVPTHRIFVDETGDHFSSHPTDLGKRYLGLVGVIMRLTVHDKLSVALEDFKKKPYDPATPPILHRREILDATGPFKSLQEDARRAAFDSDLIALLKAFPYTTIAVILDKHSHAKAKYRRLKHPYHWALLAMLERYCGWLRFNTLRGDLLAESRGKKDDMALKAAYRQFATHGGHYLSKSDAQSTLTSREAKLEKKSRNIAGLQIADILAHPLTRDTLLTYGHVTDLGSPFAAKVCGAVSGRYNCRWATGKVKGYGLVILA
jgi:hypothetical protein